MNVCQIIIINYMTLGKKPIAQVKLRLQYIEILSLLALVRAYFTCTVTLGYYYQNQYFFPQMPTNSVIVC